MSKATLIRNSADVGMGQIVVLKEDEHARAVLGSCIGLVLHDPKAKVTAIAHIVLPESKGDTKDTGKFANTAIPAMLREIARAGGKRAQLKAKFAGGASMFIAAGNMEIGKWNAETVESLLRKENIPIVAKEIGGKQGRKIAYANATDELIVEQVGQTPKSI